MGEQKNVLVRDVLVLICFDISFCFKMELVIPMYYRVQYICSVHDWYVEYRDLDFVY